MKKKKKPRNERRRVSGGVSYAGLGYSHLPISIKKITSTIESTTSRETSSEVLFLNATLYGTCEREREREIN